MSQRLKDLPAWQALTEHFQVIKSVPIEHLSSARSKAYEVLAAGWKLDYSRQPVNDATLSLLCQLAKESELESGIAALFQGEQINFTEERAVKHTALRSSFPSDEIKLALKQMERFVQAIRTGAYLGHSGKPITQIVNIGIGGSDLGPAMVTRALKPYADGKTQIHFISNIDGGPLAELFNTLNPEHTLFIVASKTFTTLETMTNAESARSWVSKALGEAALKKHFIAVTANTERAKAWGITKENIFSFWDWVGGRFSLWSAIGLSIALYLGMENFYALLKGAEAMDEHFALSPFENNMPILLALMGIWLINFHGAQSYAILPYDQSLNRLPAYLQQLEMESNGKSVNRYGERVGYSTAPVIWGEPGTNSQHAFHQLFYQGTHYIPVDIIIPLNGLHTLDKQHRLLVANAYAQAQALMQGKSFEMAEKELLNAGYIEEKARLVAPHKTILGNKPSMILSCEKMTPESLGALIALYEHKVFVQGYIWQINSFDQYGVELGKQLLKP